MSPPKIKTIAIVGAGFSGTATALNLLRLAQQSNQKINVVLIDKSDSFGKGLAYATEDDNLVLNVPAGNMSVYADLPDDFLNFCLELDSALNSGSFLFRRVYGEYLQTRLQQAVADHPGMLRRIDSTVTGLSHHDLFTLTLSSGDVLTADQVVLSFGHFAPRALSEIVAVPALNTNLCVNNPWDICALDRLPLDQDVLIVGTGHTAIDTLFRLVSVPAARKIILVSRHGHAPNGHRKAGEFVKLPVLSKEVEHIIRTLLAHQPTIRKLFAAIRKLVLEHGGDQGNWRNVINSLRGLTPEIWAALPVAERRRFLRHVVHHWDVLRHRLAPVAIRRLQGLIEAGRVEIIAGRIHHVDSEMRVAIQPRGGQTIRQLQVGSLVNCTGPNYDIHRVDNALVRQLAADGLLKQDEVRIGFHVDEQYRCSALRSLFYIGPMLKARYWEAIAVPELRVHAFNLANILLLQEQNP
jgi:uncharacterized NAD(P)/FAD-binding protein YdhS